MLLLQQLLLLQCAAAACPHPTTEIYPIPPARETQGLTDKYIGTWLKHQKRDGIVLATKVWMGEGAAGWVHRSSSCTQDGLDSWHTKKTTQTSTG
jgi:aryl-alcohol dehydrogenase-like predicted oxidoreductase